MNQWRRRVVCGALLGIMALCSQSSRAEVTPNPLFSEGTVLQRDQKVPIWGTAKNGEKVTVSFQTQKVETTAQDGKWMVWLKPLKVGGPYRMTIAGENTITLQNVLVGEVWVCSGQSNMEFGLGGASNAQEAIAGSKDPLLHLFHVANTFSLSPKAEVQGAWQESGPNTTPGFTAVGYFFGRDLRKNLNVPVGLIESNWGGTVAESWTARHALEADPSLKGMLSDFDRDVTNFPTAQQTYQTALDKWNTDAAEAKAQGKEPPKKPELYNPLQDVNRPTMLYNGMIAPLIPFGIRGVIWYQGESNAGRAYQYQTLFPTMIKDWREDWGQGNFPFLFVQLAPFMAIHQEPVESEWAELREAQRQTMRTVPNTGMAVITDVGEENDIHPKRKEAVGHRLALVALATVYGKKLEHYGPTYDSMKIEGNKVILHFKHAQGGLMTQDGSAVKGFTISGVDKKWVNATAVIQGNTVVVSSPQVLEPVAVRYGWANYPVVNLTNKSGVPASPFRTDNFQMVTQH